MSSDKSLQIKSEWRSLSLDARSKRLGDLPWDLLPDHDSESEFARAIARLTALYMDATVKERRRGRMIGLCFANPKSSLGANHIFPNTQRWRERHGVNVDFYLPGCYWSCDVDEEDDFSLGVWEDNYDESFGWFFSPNAFNAFRREIEGRTRWRYSGANDLILVNAGYREDLQKVEMDFASAIVCRLDSMNDAKAISSVGEYMESLFRFAEESSGLDPAWGFSDRKSGSWGESALWRVAVSFLPGGIAKYAADPQRCSVKFVGL